MDERLADLRRMREDLLDAAIAIPEEPRRDGPEPEDPRRPSFFYEEAMTSMRAREDATEPPLAALGGCVYKNGRHAQRGIDCPHRIRSDDHGRPLYG